MVNSVKNVTIEELEELLEIISPINSKPCHRHGFIAQQM